MNNNSYRKDLLNNLSRIKDLIVKYHYSSSYKTRGLMSDLGGLTLFCLNYGKNFKDNEVLEIGESLVDQVLSSTVALVDNKQYTYSSGASGLGWLLKHLKRYNFVDYDNNDVFNELDEHLFSYSKEQIMNGNLDFLHGSLGVIYYFIYDIQEGDNSHVVIKLLNLLMEKKLSQGDLSYWEYFNVPDGRIEVDKFNFGISHGMPAIIWMLLKFQKLTKSSDYTTAIKSAVDTLLYFKNKSLSGSLFPYEVDLNKIAEQNSRLGWCYGDLSLSQLFLDTGYLTGDDAYSQLGFHCMRHSSKRENLTLDHVVDGALCHGATGIAQIFKNYYFQTGEQEYLIVADRWYKRAIEFVKPIDGVVTGRTAWNSTTNYYDSYGLLEGLSGVGLALMSALCDDKLYWDEVLLMS